MSDPTLKQDPENELLKQLASTEAVVWSPYDADEASKTLSELLIVERQKGIGFFFFNRTLLE